jgi:glycosyltransferase involved in cell wall biosynthesis
MTAPTPLPSFSIVIPTYQRRDTVADAVRAVAGITYCGKADLTVVVDGSTDGTADALRQIACPMPFRIIEQANGGAAQARNRGAAESAGDVILFLDDDQMCAPDVLDHHAHSHLAGADAVRGVVQHDQDSPENFLTEGLQHYLAGRAELAESGAPLTALEVCTPQLSVKRSVFEALGGFDTAYTQGDSFACEDIDLGVRLFAGHKVERNPKAITRNRYVVTPREFMLRSFKAGQADLRFVKKHPDYRAELFALHTGARWWARLVYRPLARVPFAARALAVGAIWLVERPNPGAFARRVTHRIFREVRNVAYWRGVIVHGGTRRDWQ